MIHLSLAQFPDDSEVLTDLMAQYVGFLMGRASPEEKKAFASKYDPAAIAGIVEHCAEVNVPPDGAILIARDGTTVVGCGMLRRFDGTAVELQRIFIQPSARGRGLGRKITAALLERAADMGARKAYLDTGPVNHEATALYEGMGFRRCAPYHNNTPDLAHLLIYFEKDL